ncbi:DUF5518 domain-containing protein [Halocatena halophila]|uniref:DUF5518 domain-containing protein n=1 Tax=Halocatena halophila TaxID=2814576 RepID=UPI002ED27683
MPSALHYRVLAIRARLTDPAHREAAVIGGFAVCLTVVSSLVQPVVDVDGVPLVAGAVLAGYRYNSRAVKAQEAGETVAIVTLCGIVPLWIIGNSGALMRSWKVSIPIGLLFNGFAVLSTVVMCVILVLVGRWCARFGTWLANTRNSAMS